MLRMINSVETFGKVKETVESKFLAVSDGKDMMGCSKTKKYSLCGQEGTETVLGKIICGFLTL